MNGMNRRNVFFCVMFAIIIVASSITVIFFDDISGRVISTVSTLLGIFGLLYSLSLDRKISEASFLVELHNSFRGNETIRRISEKLEVELIDGKPAIFDEDRRDVEEYLVFFEMLASIEGRGVISIETFDALFGYDFFLAVNNAKVQEIALNKYSDYYTQTIRLSKKWREYRKGHRLPIPFEGN